MKKEFSLARLLPLALACAWAAAGCASTSPSSTFGRSETGQKQTVQKGVVTNVRAVNIQREGRNVAGAATGAVVGTAVAGPIGTVGGAVAGSAIQGAAGSSTGVEVTVRLDNGQTVAIVQDGSVDAFRAGDKVNVTTSGTNVRVSRR